MFKPGMPHAQADLLASLIEEGDFTASLGESLHQVARRLERQPFSAAGRELVEATLARIEQAMRPLLGAAARPRCRVASDAGEEAQEFLAATRERCLAWGADLPWEERGAILELLGSAERALFLIARIIEERRSVPRAVPAPVETAAPVGDPGLAPA